MDEILLPDYKKIASRVQRKTVSVEKEEMEDNLIWLQKSRAKLSQITRSCRMGDFVEIQFATDVDHKPYQDAFVLGEGKYVPGFENKIEGMTAGEETSFSLDLPLDYMKKELAGSKVSFKVKMQSIQKVELPELTDEFAKSLGEFGGLVQLRNSLRGGLRREKEAAESRRIRQEILDNILRETDFEIPEVFMQAEQKKMMELLKEEVKQKLQMDFKDYLTKAHQSEGEIRNNFLPEAEKRARDFLVLRTIAAAEQIEVAEDEVSEGAAQFLNKYSGAQEAEKTLDPAELRAYIKGVILQEKTLAKLEEYTKT